MPFLTLMDVLTYSDVLSKFKCVARVVAVFPYRVQDFSYNQIYRIRLTIEDPTARIHAFVYGEDGEKFFGGHPTVDVLTRKRNKLLGVTIDADGEEMDAHRNPPWLQCCIKSYFLDGNDMWGSRHYRIFGTELAG
uniref:Protection of telomeres protein 1b-like n=1 Tax=Rhizophora mucronata TaxID=61149 RepID=A0A2P2M0A1_RHIMU